MKKQIELDLIIKDDVELEILTASEIKLSDEPNEVEIRKLMRKTGGSRKERFDEARRLWEQQNRSMGRTRYDSE